MIEKSCDFPLEMFCRIEEAARKEKITTAAIIRETVSFAVENSILFTHKQHLYKQDIHKGFTEKRKVVHFTPEQVYFLENTATENNLYISEVIRVCVEEYFNDKAVRAT